MGEADFSLPCEVHLKGFPQNASLGVVVFWIDTLAPGAHRHEALKCVEHGGTHPALDGYADMHERGTKKKTLATKGSLMTS